MRLLRQVAFRNGMKQCKVGPSKMHSTTLKNIRFDFSIKFMKKNERINRQHIFNADETGIYYIPKVLQSLALFGEGNKCIGHTKHGGRLTALLTIAASGKKLPILIVLPGKPGGKIEKQEIPELKKHLPEVEFVVQEHAWMDTRIWNYNLIKC